MILRPFRMSMNSFLVLCRRTDRVPVTSTDLIFLPTTSRSRSRRMTSTSGSSGIPVSPFACMFFLQLFLAKASPRDPGRPLLGLFLGSAFTVAEALVVEIHRREEVLGVIRALVADHITGTPDRLRCGQLLETRLVVAAAGARDGFGDPLAQTAKHEIARGREIGIEVHRGDDRLERVGEDRLLGPPTRGVFTLAEQQMLPEVDLGRDFGEHARVHNSRANFRELPFGE